MVKDEAMDPANLVIGQLGKRSDARAVLIGASPQEISAGDGGQRLYVINVCVARSERTRSVLGG
jgi:hypothetical protein